MLADVDAGSDTPSLVGKVLKWRKEDNKTGMSVIYWRPLPFIISVPAEELWNALDKVNHALSKTLLRLSELHARNEKAYVKAVKYLSTLQTVQVRRVLPSAPSSTEQVSSTASGSSTPTSRALIKKSWRRSRRRTSTPRCAPLPPSPVQTPPSNTLAHSPSHPQEVRAKMREMGSLSGVPIEPPEQTKLLDTCVSGAGVIGGGVPGGLSASPPPSS